MNIMARIFLYFIIYSLFGWVMEVCVSFYDKRRFVNRGFLIGPICPIYGVGVLLIVTLIGNTSDIFTIFLKSIFVCSILEYFTSYLMEKLFHARWWDYSNSKYNINGRICLNTMIPFGILGTIFTKFVHPFVVKNILSLDTTLVLVIAVIIFILFLIDNIISFNVLSKIKNQINNNKGDNTELIRKKVLSWIDANSALFRRIKAAFPKFEIYKKVLKRIKK